MTAHFTIVSAIDAGVRDRAIGAMVAARPTSGVVRYDVGGCPPTVVRTALRAGSPVASRVTGLDGPIDHHVAADLADVLADPPEGRGSCALVLGLPPGVSAHAVLDLLAGLDLPASAIVVDAVVAVVDADTLHDRLWSPRTLVEDGMAVSDPELETGAFLVGELLLADEVTVVVPDEAEGTETAVGVELIGHLAPQARLSAVGAARLRAGLPDPGTGRGRHDEREATWRTTPGQLQVPVVLAGERIRTHVASLARPLHPQRWAETMPDLAAGCVWSRGRMWIASLPERRIAWLGVGPGISFDDTGLWWADRPATDLGDHSAEGHGDGPAEHPDDVWAITAQLDWHPVHGDRGTRLAFTGEEVDPADIDRLLQHCALTDAELALGPDGWRTLPDPLDLRRTFAAAVPT